MHSSFYSCLGRVLIILSAPSEVFSSPRPPRQAPQLLSECLVKLPLVFLFFSLSPYVSRLVYRPSSSQRANSPILSLGISPFSYLWLEFLMSWSSVYLTLPCGAWLWRRRAVVGKSLPCRDRKSQLMASFVSLPGVQPWPWGIKHGPLSKSSLHKSMCCGSAQRQAWCEAQAAVPMKPLGILMQGLRACSLSFCLNEIFKPLPKFIPLR